MYDVASVTNNRERALRIRGTWRRFNHIESNL